MTIREQLCSQAKYVFYIAIGRGQVSAPGQKIERWEPAEKPGHFVHRRSKSSLLPPYAVGYSVRGLGAASVAAMSHVMRLIAPRGMSMRFAHMALAVAAVPIASGCMTLTHKLDLGFAQELASPVRQRR